MHIFVLKMHKFILLLFILTIVVLGVSCTKEITLDFKHDPKLTFNCILNPDSTIKAELSFSRVLGGVGEFIPAEGAKIKFFENDEFLGELTELGNGDYSLQYYPKIGSTYFVEIKYMNYQILTASTIVPKKTKIEFVPIHMQPEDENQRIIVKIHDNIGHNYYWNYGYSISKKNGRKHIASIFPVSSPHFDNFNRELEADFEYGFYYHYMLRIKDTLHDGEVLQWKKKSNSLGLYYCYDIYLETDSCYDQYLKTTIQTRMLENEEIPMSEPVQIFSNVENGYGIFGSCVKTVRKF